LRHKSKTIVLKDASVSDNVMNTVGTVSHEEVQAFIDEILALNLSRKHREWYQVDVSAVLDGCQIQGHEVDSASGDSLIFLKSSLLFCSPESGLMRHYPRSLIHCFIEDKRLKSDPEDEDLLFRGELFSVTPESEQLCWVRDCTLDHEIPSTQSIISSWMKWLNQA
jgi:hypothetical protein